MYRALVIGLGDRFRPAVRRLDRLAPTAGSDDASDEAISGFSIFESSEQTSTGESFRDELRERTVEQLTSLLEVGASPPSGRPELDLFVLADLAEPSVRAVLIDAIETLGRLISEEFEPIFPAFRSADQRRIRIVAVTAISERDPDSRLEAYATLRTLQDEASGSQTDEPATSLLDRVYLLDRVTPTGIVPPETLVESAENFVELVAATGARHSDPIAGLVEGGGTELFGTVSVAVWSVEIAGARERLVDRLSFEIASMLTPEPPEPSEVDPPISLSPLRRNSTLDDDELFGSLRDRIETKPRSARNTGGVAEAIALTSEYELLVEKLHDARSRIESALGELDQNNGQTDADPGETSTSKSGTRTRIISSFVAGLLLFTAMFGASDILFEISSRVRLTWGLIFGVIGALLTWWLSGFAVSESSSETTARNDRGDRRRRLETRRERLETLAESAELVLHRLQNMRRTLEALRDELDVRRNPREASTESQSDSLPLRSTIETERVDDAIFESHLRYRDVAEATRLFGDSLPPISEWEAFDELPADRLRSFAEEAFETMAGEDIFARREIRRAASEQLASFLEVWCHGLPLFVDLQSRAQYDPDGFHTAAENLIIAPTQLARAAERIEIETPGLTRGLDLEYGDRLFIVRALHDVHPEVLPEPDTEQ